MHSHATVPAADDLVAAASSLVPYLIENAALTEKARQIPAETIRRLRDAGLFGSLVPSRFGGYEHDLNTTARIVVELGRGCGSTAWVYSVTAWQSWVVATVGFEAQEEVWASGPQSVISGTYGPNPKQQTVARVDRGFRLSGRWGFASGCDHADWHLVQFLALEKASPAQASYFALVPRQDFVIDDDWHVMGLAGTGSKTVVLDNVFVPEHRSLDYRSMNSGETPGATRHTNPIYAMPLMSVTPIGLALPILGVARGALDSLISSAVSGARDSARGKFADHTLAHAWIGEALASIDAATLVMFGGIADLTAVAKAGRRPSIDERVRLRRDYAFAIHLCVQAVNLMLNCTGASGIVLTNQIQRAWRDINSAARHIGLNWEPYAIQSGRIALQLEPNGLY